MKEQIHVMMSEDDGRGRGSYRTVLSVCLEVPKIEMTAARDAEETKLFTDQKRAQNKVRRSCNLNTLLGFGPIRGERRRRRMMIGSWFSHHFPHLSHSTKI